MPLLRWSSVQSACARYAVGKSDVARVARGHRCESHALKLSRNQTFRACVRTGSRVGAISASELFGGVSRGIGGSRACQAIGPGLSGHAEPTGSGRRAAQSSASGFAHILAKCQGWSTSEGTGGGRWCERRTAVCGWGAGGGVARGRGGAGRAQAKDCAHPSEPFSAVGNRPGYLPSIISKPRFHQLETPSVFLPGALLTAQFSMTIRRPPCNTGRPSRQPRGPPRSAAVAAPRD